jgi:transcriptional regulator with XRE-family HTH domain
MLARAHLAFLSSRGAFRLSRPTIADLARAAGVSVATVDRVLNARHRVREPTAERVLGAAVAIGFHGTPLLKSRLRSNVPERTFAFLLQREDAFYAQFGADLAAATLALTQFRARPVVDFAPDLSAGVVAERLLRAWRICPCGRDRLGRSSAGQRRDCDAQGARRADLRDPHRARGRGRRPLRRT